jgi:hypothetical protein
MVAIHSILDSRCLAAPIFKPSNLNLHIAWLRATPTLLGILSTYQKPWFKLYTLFFLAAVCLCCVFQEEKALLISTASPGQARMAQRRR